MSILICQASIDEHGNAKGGVAGDQTSKEVFVRDWYEADWHTCLRPKNEELAQKSVAAAVYLANCNYVGYDQKQRNSLHTLLRLNGYNWEKLNHTCETDCSAFMTAVALCGGAKTLEYLVNAPVTSNMVEKFVESGYYEALTDKKYLTGTDYLQPGDILVKKGHTIIIVGVSNDEVTQNE